MKLQFVSTKERALIIAGSLVFAIILTYASLTYFAKNPIIFQILSILAVSSALGPSLYFRYSDYSRSIEIETKFPLFLTDVVDGVRAGMTLPQAMRAASKHDYGKLNAGVRQMNSQIDWGIPFDDVLKSFAEKSGTPVLKRTTTTIIETHRSGGNIVDVLNAVAGSIMEINRIKKERSSQIYGQMITGYTIFFIFLGVLIGLQKFLLPSLSGLGGSIEGGISSPIGSELYENLFRMMIIIQGTFSGLAIGKMAEGSVFGGLKHSIALVAIGYGAWMASGAIPM
ncbi:MAG: type II secretion system F family protein [Candidatus Aenigmatarchaeota archaeon]